MGTVTVEVRMIPGGLNDLLRGRGGVVWRDMERRARNVAAKARDEAPVGVVGGGSLRNNIQSFVEFDNRVPVGIVRANVKHATWVHEGTGVYVGRPPLRPRTARYMVFSVAYGRYRLPEWAGNYWATVIKGQPGNPYLLRSLDRARH